MTRILPLALAALFFLLAPACGGPESPSTDGASGDPALTEDCGHNHAEGAHGGAVAVLGDHIAHMEAIHDADTGIVTVWFSDGDMKPLAADGAPVLNVITDEGSVRVEPTAHEGGWRFAHASLEGHPEKARFRFTLAGKTFTPDLPCEHGDAHVHGPDCDHGAHGQHAGTLVAFQDDSGAVAGYLELKLHDDKGDLELWLNLDEDALDPFDLPVDATVSVIFEKPTARTVTLAVRNLETNEDEDGVANLRDGTTNYFIFPGDTGADAAWLMGADFAGTAVVRFEKDGVTYATEALELRPHTHTGAGHDHD